MSMRQQLLYLIALPLVGLIFLSVILSWINFSKYHSALQTETAISEAVALTALVHTLQVERGQSAGFIASEGKNFARTLPDVRAETDRVMALDGLQSLGLRDSLKPLATKRSEVSGLALTVPQMASWYTATIRHVLETAQHRLMEQSDPKVTRYGAGLVALGEAKEAAGLQRAAGAAGLGMGQFPSPLYSAFLERGAVESRMLEMAALELGAALATVDIASLAEKSGIAAFREAIKSAGANAPLPGISVSDWFANATSWIDALREVELHVAGQVTEIAQANAKTSLWICTATALSSLLIILLCAIGGHRVLQSTARQFTALERAMQRLAKKDFEGRSHTPDLRTEIGRIFASVDKTREALADADQKMEEASAQRVAVLQAMAIGLEQLSERDLNAKILDDFPEDYVPLRDSFNSAIEALNRTLGNIRHSVVPFHSISERLHQDSEKMSSRTASQAAALEQTTAALSELTHSVSGAAKKAAEAFQGASVLKQTSDNGQARMDETLSIMREISVAADKMSAMIAMIDDIAFQTNLLAINAGVEAARAGETGRGFAVVAGEVRQLAVRASSTANEIKSVIGDTGVTITRGVELLDAAAQAFGAINQEVLKTTASVEGIAEDSSTQATSVSEIRSAMLALDHNTQENAAMVDEISRHATALNSKATEVKFLVDAFRLNVSMTEQWHELGPASPIPDAA